jgi:hypothetical protein
MLYDYSNPRIDDWMDEFENSSSVHSVDEFACELVAELCTEGSIRGLPVAEPVAEPVREMYADEDESSVLLMETVRAGIVGFMVFYCGRNTVEGLAIGMVGWWLGEMCGWRVRDR